MKEEDHRQTEAKKRHRPADGAQVLLNDLTEIDPSELVDPEEFGMKPVSSSATRGPWGCLWCKKPPPKLAAMARHHARHCSEDIARDNEGWITTRDG